MEKQLIPRKDSIVSYNEEEEYYLKYEVQSIEPVKRNLWGHFLHILLSIVTLGLFYLILVWNKKLWVNVRFTKTKIELATHIIIVNEHGEEILVDKRTEFDENGNLKIVIIYRYLKYLYEKGEWIMQRNSLKLLHSEILEMSNGIRVENYELLRSVFGQNSTKVQVDSWGKVFTEEALSSFNVYQLFACIVWFFRDYIQYAAIILLFVFLSILFEVALIRGEQKKINQMALTLPVKVFRKKYDRKAKTFLYFNQTIDSSELVPGDVVEVEPDAKIPCDLVILDGKCLVDESLLTGESVPVLKTKLPKNDELFSEDNKENILFAGTYCLTSTSSRIKEAPAKALVFQIGFGTKKGRLIRSIMFNDPGEYKFERDSNFFTFYLFLGSLVFVAIYYYIAFTQHADEMDDFWNVFLPSLDIILTMVPPGLSLSLSIGIEYAQNRLKGKQIVALKGKLINAAGRMKAVFFDKTGTLTINEMKLDSVYLSLGEDGDKKLLDYEFYTNDIQNKLRLPAVEEETEIMKHFATNHTLSYIKGQILGDPMEDELFSFSKAALIDEHADHRLDRSITENEEPRHLKKVRLPGPLYPKNAEAVQYKSKSKSLYVTNILDFKSHLQRMSVIVKDLRTNTNTVYCKGAPEKVIQLCKPETLPPDLTAQVKRDAKHGFRILAFGYKTVTDEEIANGHREFFESGLTFQGIALFKNNLKAQTKPTMRALKRAEFAVGMITGDNIDTAICIAKNCRLIELSKEEIFTINFAIDGTLDILPVDQSEEYDSFDSESSESEDGMVGNTLANPNRKASKKHQRTQVCAIDSDNFSRVVGLYNLEEEGKVIDLEIPVIKVIATKCRIFARMSPEQKALIVKILKTYHKSFEETVGFCGDGANDCLALKEADIGVSLAQTEASLSAPFLSSIQDISCIPLISTEGKAALTTNFDSFRFFCLYSIIQTIGLIYLFAKETEYSNAVYITCDIFFALNIANCIGLLKSIKRLTKKLPESTLFYPELIISIILNCILAFICFQIGLHIIHLDSGYQTPEELAKRAESDKAGPDNTLPTYETTMVGLYAMQTTFQVAMSFNIKGRFKDRFYKLPYMVVSFIVYQLFVLYLLYVDLISEIVPATRPVNDWIIGLFYVAHRSNLVRQIRLEHQVNNGRDVHPLDAPVPDHRGCPHRLF